MAPLRPNLGWEPELTRTPTGSRDRRPNRFFRAWARVMIQLRFPILGLTALITAGAIWAIHKKHFIDNSVESFSASTADSTRVLEEFRDDFGRDDLFLVLIEGDVFSPEYLDKVAKLTAELEDISLYLPTLGERKIDRDLLRGRISVEEWRDKSRQSTNVAQPTAGDEGFDEDFDEDFGEGFGDEADTVQLEGVLRLLEQAARGEWPPEGSIVDEVVSIVNVRKTRTVGESGLQVGELMDPFPTTAEAIAALRTEVLGDPAQGIPPDQTLVGQVVSADGKWSAVMVRTHFMGDPDSIRVNDHIAEILERYEAPGFRTQMAGMPALGASLNRMLLGDLQTLFGLAMIVLSVILFVMFRHPIGALAPIGVVALSGIWSFGLMFAMGMAMTMLHNVLPAFLICVGVADSIHVLSVYRDERKVGTPNQEAIERAVESTGLPVFFTSLTTAMGLLSFQLASVDAIGEMGLIGAIGVAFAFTHTLTFLPIMLTFNRTSLLGVRDHSESAPRRVDFIDRFLSVLAGLSGPTDRRRNRVLISAAVLTLIAIGGASMLRVWHNPLAWVPAGEPIRIAVDAADEHLGGTSSLQLLIEARAPSGVKDVELLKGLEQLEAYVKEYADPETGERIVGNVISIVDVVRETNQALLGGDREHRRIPDTQPEVNDRFTMFENAGPDQLKRMMTLDAQKAQMTIRTRWLEATSYAPLTEYVAVGVERFIGSDKATVRTTGAAFNLLSTVSALLFDLLKSFTAAFVVITLLMMFLLRDIKLALIAMVPNLLPIAYIMGLMGYADIPIDMANLLIASIALGLAVDDTIHFLHHYKVHFEATGDTEAAIAHSMQHSGRAIVVTSIVLCAGFFVYLGATMYSLQRFGALIGLTVIFALLLDLILGPALLRTFFKSRPRTDGAAAGQPHGGEADERAHEEANSVPA